MNSDEWQGRDTFRCILKFISRIFRILLGAFFRKFKSLQNPVGIYFMRKSWLCCFLVMASECRSEKRPTLFNEIPHLREPLARSMAFLSIQTGEGGGG